MNKKIIYILVVVIGVVLVGWIILSNNENKSAQNSLIPAPVPAVVQKNSDTSALTLGDAQAPVTIVEYGHFKCPFCNRFFREVEPQIEEGYIKTGKVKFIWKDFPYEGGDSVRASEAAYCSQDQGKFWEYRNILFNHIWENYYNKGLNAEEAEIFTAVKLKELAGQIGLDTAEFSSCLDTAKYKQLVQDNYNEGISKGVKSTPTFFINGQKVVGAQSFSLFSKIIDSQLK